MLVKIKAGCPCDGTQNQIQIMMLWKTSEIPTQSESEEPPPSSSRPAWWSSILSQSSRISSLSISSFPLTILAGWMVVYVVYEIFSLIFGRLINAMIGGSRERKLMLLGFTKSSSQSTKGSHVKVGESDLASVTSRSSPQSAMHTPFSTPSLPLSLSQHHWHPGRHQHLHRHPGHPDDGHHHRGHHNLLRASPCSCMLLQMCPTPSPDHAKCRCSVLTLSTDVCV